LIEPGLLKALNELKRYGIIREVVIGTRKKYELSTKAKELKVYQTAKLLKKKLEMLK